MQIYNTKPARKGYSGFTADELTARLEKVSEEQETANKLQEEVIKKYPEQYRVNMPLASDQEVTEKMMIADEQDVRHQIPDNKGFGLRQDLMNDLKKQHVEQVNWDKVTEAELRAMNQGKPVDWDYQPLNPQQPARPSGYEIP